MAHFNQGEEWAFKLSRELTTKNARIAELTEQLSLSDRLLVAEMRAKDELTAEVAMRRKALADVAKESWNLDGDVGDKIRDLIRNALKVPACAVCDDPNPYDLKSGVCRKCQDV